jgi:hypothetical protein
VPPVYFKRIEQQQQQNNAIICDVYLMPLVTSTLTLLGDEKGYNLYNLQFHWEVYLRGRAT